MLYIALFIIFLFGMVVLKIFKGILKLVLLIILIAIAIGAFAGLKDDTSPVPSGSASAAPDHIHRSAHS